MTRYQKPLKWTVTFSVAPVWVADGFNLNEERAMDMLQSTLGYASQDELDVEIVMAPDAKIIRRLQVEGVI